MQRLGRSLAILASILVACLWIAASASAQNGGQGANGPGDFTSDPNRTPTASQNGQGGGNATGRPDAGSVGNADDKNPPGQSHNPEDNNSGYECDANSGVGVGNPAHTGCAEQQNPTQVPGQPTQVPGQPTHVPGQPTQVPGQPTQVPGQPTQVPGQPTKPGESAKTPSTGGKAQPGPTVAVGGMPSTGAGDGMGSGAAFPAMLIAGAALLAGAGISVARQQRATRR